MLNILITKDEFFSTLMQSSSRTTFDNKTPLLLYENLKLAKVTQLEGRMTLHLSSLQADAMTPWCHRAA